MRDFSIDIYMRLLGLDKDCFSSWCAKLPEGSTMVDPSGNFAHQLEKQSLSSPSNLIYISIGKYGEKSLL